jgi:hypothetical protein
MMNFGNCLFTEIGFHRLEIELSHTADTRELCQPLFFAGAHGARDLRRETRIVQEQ